MKHSIVSIGSSRVGFLSRAAVAAFALVGASAFAEPKMSEAQMMDACVQKYIAVHLADYEGKVTVNKHAGGYYPRMLNARTQVHVSAVHRASGEHLGTVVCDVAKDGSVTVAAPNAMAAAKLEKLARAPVVARNAVE